MTKQQKKLSDQIRDALVSSGKSRYAIFKATGIDQAVLSRFLAGKCGLEMATLDTLAEYLNLTIKSPKRKG
jgi:transcriptional regulator with XRE-family HTH domain